MPLINWTSEYAVNVKLLDDQHKEMISSMNEIYDRAEKVVVSPTEVDGLFDRIKVYFMNHFGTEEKYFDLFKYEGTNEHKKAHSDVLVELGELKERYHTNASGALLYELIELLENHLFSHIMKFDKKYTKCFNEHGLY